MPKSLKSQTSKSLKAKRPILVPVDFSKTSRAALAWAAELAAKTRVALVILHVIHDPESGPGFYARPKRKGFLNRMEDAATDIMEEFMSKVRKEIDALGELEEVHEIMVVGLPANRILEVAESIDARHIVVGSQGRTGLARILLGSKAERVVQLAPMPVTIIKTPAKRSSGA